MVKFIGGFHSDEARGTFNKWLTYQRSGHGSRKPTSKQPNSAAQRNVRYWLYQGSHSWRYVFWEQMQGWGVLGVLKKLPGYQRFLSTYLKKVLAEEMPYRDVEETDSFIWQFYESWLGYPIFGDIVRYPYYKER